MVYQDIEDDIANVLYSTLFRRKGDFSDEYLLQTCIHLYWNTFVKSDCPSPSQMADGVGKDYFKIEPVKEDQVSFRLAGNYRYSGIVNKSSIEYCLYPPFSRILYLYSLVQDFPRINNIEVLIKFDKTMPDFLLWAKELIAKTRCLYKANQITASTVEGYASLILNGQRFIVYPCRTLPIIRVAMKRDFVLSVLLPFENMAELIDGIPNLIQHPLLIKEAGKYYHLCKGDYRIFDEKLLDFFSIT